MLHINFNLYHYAGNNPILYLDPDGRAERDNSNVKLSDHFKSDKFGREILYHYLYGNEKKCDSEDWQNYMRSNETLSLEIATKVLDNFNSLISSNNFEVNWNDKFTIGPEGAKFGE